MSKIKCYNSKKEGHFAKDCKKAKIKDYNYYKTKMLLAKKDSDEQTKVLHLLKKPLLSLPTRIKEFVKSDNKKEDKKADEKNRDMSKIKCYNSKKEGHFAKDCKKAKIKDYNYYKTKMLLAKKDSDEQVLLAEDQA
nr:hypothetical protein [Tanacetum cinerariifolium]